LYANDRVPAAVPRVNAVTVSTNVAVWWRCCPSAGAFGMSVSIDQCVMTPFGPSSACQCRRVTVGERPIASPMMRWPLRVTRSTDVVSLPRTATNP
jgi:hypothetical protein